jgi:hypothetical protein
MELLLQEPIQKAQVLLKVTVTKPGDLASQYLAL